MNSSRFIEGATLMSVGVFCASALISFVLHGTHLLKSHDEQVATIALPSVTVSAKRLNATEKALLQKEEQAEQAKALMGARTNNGNAHAG